MAFVSAVLTAAACRRNAQKRRQHEPGHFGRRRYVLHDGHDHRARQAAEVEQRPQHPEVEAEAGVGAAFEHFPVHFIPSRWDGLVREDLPLGALPAATHQTKLIELAQVLVAVHGVLGHERQVVAGGRVTRYDRLLFAGGDFKLPGLGQVDVEQFACGGVVEGDPAESADGANQRSMQDDIGAPPEGQGRQARDVGDEVVADVADQLVLGLEGFVLGQSHPHLADDWPGLLVWRMAGDVVHPKGDGLQEGQGLCGSGLSTCDSSMPINSRRCNRVARSAMSKRRASSATVGKTSGLDWPGRSGTRSKILNG